jgi:hypothetical protein
MTLRKELIDYGADAGPHSIHAALTTEMKTPPAVTTIWRILTRAGLITPEPRKRPRRTYLRFEADLPKFLSCAVGALIVELFPISL